MNKYDKKLANLVGMGCDGEPRWSIWAPCNDVELARARAVVKGDGRTTPNAALWAVLHHDGSAYAYSVILSVRATVPRLGRDTDDPSPNDLSLEAEVLCPTQDRVRYAVRMISAAWLAVNRSAPSSSEFESAVDSL